MRSRWLSTFTIIGALLIVLGLVGVILGPRFIYDPGQIANGKEPWYYLAIGALMVVNGFFTPLPEKKDPDPKARAQIRNGTGTVEPTEAPASSREVAVSVGDQSRND